MTVRRPAPRSRGGLAAARRAALLPAAPRAGPRPTDRAASSASTGRRRHALTVRLRGRRPARGRVARPRRRSRSRIDGRPCRRRPRAVGDRPTTGRRAPRCSRSTPAAAWPATRLDAAKAAAQAFLDARARRRRGRARHLRRRRPQRGRAADHATDASGQRGHRRTSATGGGTALYDGVVAGRRRWPATTAPAAIAAAHRRQRTTAAARDARPTRRRRCATVRRRARRRLHRHAADAAAGRSTQLADASRRHGRRPRRQPSSPRSFAAAAAGARQPGAASPCTVPADARGQVGRPSRVSASAGGTTVTRHGRRPLSRHRGRRAAATAGRRPGPAAPAHAGRRAWLLPVGLGRRCSSALLVMLAVALIARGRRDAQRAAGCVAGCRSTR